MEFNYAYGGDSAVANGLDHTAMSFAPDTLRQSTYFRGELRKGLAFREAISALHDVVVSDLRWKPKDRTAYLRWLEGQEGKELAEIGAQRSKVAAQVRQVQAELDRLRQASYERSRPFQNARARYFEYLLKRDYQAWIVLDPVITVHPDEVFFECFSKDESSYGRLGVGFDEFQKVGEFACGTTNIDYSESLYDEFQKVRSYKTTRFGIDPSGFEVAHSGGPAYKAVKIDLPDSWVRGFLQVSSAMALPALRFELHPMDVHNICLVLRRHRELVGPRGMQYCLEPGQPVRVLFEPWGFELSVEAIEHDPFEEPFIEIRRRQGSEVRLVASIEVVSPANKTPGNPGREKYLAKQREILAGQAYLIEIDLLRGGTHVTAVPRELAIAKAGPFDYHVCVHRFDRPNVFSAYPIQLEQRLPGIAIPLLPGDPAMPLSLQAVFDRAYHAGPYRRAINYGTDRIIAPLQPKQLEWVKARLQPPA